MEAFMLIFFCGSDFMNKKRVLKTMFLFMATLMCTLLFDMANISAAYEGETPVATYDVSESTDGSVFVNIYENKVDSTQYDMHVTGNGAVKDFENSIPWVNMEEGDPYPYEPKYNITSVLIDDSITNIGRGLFAFLPISSIEIPSSVTSIGDSAFAYTKLTSINIPLTVTNMGDTVFAYTYNLTTVEGLKGISEIPASTFEGSGLTSIEIPSNITAIHTSAFENCVDLASVSGMEGVEYIYDFSFRNTAITSLNLPASLILIEPKACENCEDLVEYIVDENNSSYSSLNGILYSKSKEVLYSYPENKIGDAYTTDDFVTSIAEYAFLSNNNLTTLRISNAVTSIGEYAIQESQISTIIVDSLEMDIATSAFVSDSLTMLKGHIGSTTYAHAYKYDIYFESLCELIVEVSDNGNTKIIKSTDCNKVYLEISKPINFEYTGLYVSPHVVNTYDIIYDIIYKDAQGHDVEPINVGEYTAIIEFFGVEVTVVYSIIRATPVVTAPVANVLEYNWLPQELVTAAYSTGGELQYRVDDGEWITDIPVATNPGVYVVWYRVVGDDNYYDVAPQSVNVEITSAPLIVTAPTAIEGLKYTGEQQTLVEEGTTSFGAMQYKLDDGEWSSELPKAKHAGVYTVWYKVEVTNYQPHGPHSFNVEIEKVTPVLTVPVARELIYNTEEQELVVAGFTTGGDLEYKVNDGEWSMELPCATVPGTYKVYYRVNGGTNYYDIPEAMLTIVMEKATPVVTAPVAKNLTYNGEEQELVEAGSTDIGCVEYSLDNVEWSNNLPKAINAGTYQIWYKVDINEYYNTVGPILVEVEIEKAAIQYTAPTPKTIVYNGWEQVLINEGYASQGEMQYKLEGGDWSRDLPTAVNINTYLVWYRVLGNTNYADVDQQYVEVTIVKATPHVLPPAPKTLNYTGYDQVLIEAGSTDMGVLQYSLDGVTYASELPIAKNAGTYTIWFMVNGTENYNAINPLSITVIINKVEIVITADDKVMDERDSFPNFTYKVEGLLANDTLTKEPTRTLNDPETAKNKAGVYDIVIKDANAGENYTITYVNAKLTVNNKLTGGEIALIVTSITATIALGAGTCWFIIFKKKRILINRA